MNKLVSRNPVLRFKLGKLIIFAQKGTYFPVEILGKIFLYNPYNGLYKGFQDPKQNLSYLDIKNSFNTLYENIPYNGNAVYRKKGTHDRWLNNKGEKIDLTPQSQKKIPWMKNSLAVNKRFRLAASDNSGVMEFDTEQEAQEARKKYGIVGRITDMKGASRGQVVKTDRTSGKDAKTTAYDRQELEKDYNNLSYKDAYKKAQTSGNKFFGYKGKVYKTDLKDGKDNISEMVLVYGENLGWSKNPKLLSAPSRAARKDYLSRVEATDNSRSVTPLETNSSANAKADLYTKLTWNNGKGFADLIMPTNILMHLGLKAYDKIAGTEYSKNNNNIYAFGLNPFGYAEDLADGNLGKLAVRGVDAYSWLGAPGASRVIDYFGTKMAPKITSTTLKYIPKGGTEKIIDETGNTIGRTLNKWNWRSITGNGSTRVNSFGNRSIQRAAKEGVLDPLTINGGINNATKYGTAAILNPNTKTTLIFRNVDGAGNIVGNTYDNAIDNAMLIAPWYQSLIVNPTLHTAILK